MTDKAPLGTVRLARKSLQDLIPAPYNPRQIDDASMGGLEKSIGRFGLVEPIVVNDATGRIVGGHQRAKALQRQGVTETDVVLVTLSPDEEKALNVALNSPKIAGTWTPEIRALLDEIEVSVPDLFIDLRLNDLEHDMETLFPIEVEAEPDEAAPEPPADPVSRLGDLILLGRHRLLCGDSTKAEDVERLLDGAVPFLMVTDPPYGVAYDPKWRKEAGLRKGGADGAVRNDDRADWPEAYALFPGDVAYVWHSALFASVVAHNLIDTGFLVRSQIIWRKARFAISRGAYHWGHEPCWYTVRKGKSARWAGDRKQSTIWDVPHVANETGHGTQKPLECMARPIRNHGAEGDEVYDPFVGSGTTLMACEALGRTCYAMELDPAYVDVVIERWEKATGNKAERIRAS